MKTFNAKEVLEIDNNNFAKYDCVYQIRGMTKIVNFEATDNSHACHICTSKTIRLKNDLRQVGTDEIFYNKLIEPLAKLFENLYHNKTYYEYISIPFAAPSAVNSDAYLAAFISPDLKTEYGLQRLKTDNPAVLYTYNELLEARKHKAKILGLEVGIRMDIIEKNKIIPLIRPIAEQVATHIVEFSNELKKQGELNAGIFVRNQFIPPMFWTSNEDISKDEIMEQVDGYLNRYLFYRDFVRGKKAINDEYSIQLTKAGYDINACNFTNEDVLSELVPIGKQFSSELEEISYIDRSRTATRSEIRLSNHKPR